MKEQGKPLDPSTLLRAGSVRGKQKNNHMRFQSPKGMHDILPSDELLWERLRKQIREVADAYNFLCIDTTLLEPAALFEASLGATSDVVEKQMFSFKTKSGDMLVLRPEGTAGVARAYIQHGLSQMTKPLKLYYSGLMFRYEQPQAGRFRQFHQVGFEILGGDEDPIYDAQTILVCVRLLEALKIKHFVVKLNSIGCKNCRPIYRKRLIDYYKEHVRKAGKTSSLCEDCEHRLAVTPLRLLDCKQPGCQELRKDAPVILNGLCIYCKNAFKNVLEYLEELKIPYTLDDYLVRGLDYYNRTVFEIFVDSHALPTHNANASHHEGPSFDLAIGGGGRYDYLIELLGGRETAAVGGAFGLERIIDVLKNTGIEFREKPSAKVFLIHIGDLAKKRSLALIELLRGEGIDVGECLGKESLKAQLRSADKSHAPFALIFGQKEALEESIIVRDLQTGAQETVPLHRLVADVKRRLK